MYELLVWRACMGLQSFICRRHLSAAMAASAQARPVVRRASPEKRAVQRPEEPAEEATVVAVFETAGPTGIVWSNRAVWGHVRQLTLSLVLQACAQTTEACACCMHILFERWSSWDDELTLTESHDECNNNTVQRQGNRRYVYIKAVVAGSVASDALRTAILCAGVAPPLAATASSGSSSPRSQVALAADGAGEIAEHRGALIVDEAAAAGLVLGWVNTTYVKHRPYHVVARLVRQAEARASRDQPMRLGFCGWLPAPLQPTPTKPGNSNAPSTAPLETMSLAKTSSLASPTRALSPRAAPPPSSPAQNATEHV